MTNFSKILTKFAISQHLFRGLVITVGVLLPCLLLEHFGLFGKMVALPLGTLMVSLTDNPGPHKRRIRTLVISLAVYFFVAISTSYLRHFPGIIFLLIILYGLFFSLIGVFGLRATTVGTTALIIFIFNLDDHLSQGQYIASAVYFLLGGCWYLIIFYALDWLKPYIVIEQLMSEYLYEIGNYLKLKSEFYHHDADFDQINIRLLASQTLIRTQQDDLREILFKTRAMVKESTPKGRALMGIFLDSIELFERIMTTQYDYTHLNSIMKDSHIVPYFGAFISRLAHELERIAISIPLEKPLPENDSLENDYQKCEKFFFELRKEKLNPDTINDFIMLRQILNSLKDLTNRIKNIQNTTDFNRNQLVHDIRLDQNLKKFTPTDTYSLQLLKDNISLESSHFRHAIRVTVALLLGYIVSLFLPVGHAYWLLLTIVVLLKPSYSISRQRNIYRLIGTLLGIALGFLAVYFIHSDTVMFILLAAFMVLGYSMLKLNYLIATFGITVFILLTYYFINPNGIKTLIVDRVVDTAVACLIVWLTSFFVLPVWEESQIMTFMSKALNSNFDYFKTTVKLVLSNQYDDEAFRLSRKNAFIQLGNLSDLFQRMLTEPKAKQQKLTSLHQYVTTSHILTSYIASLSYYAHTNSEKFNEVYLVNAFTKIDNSFEKTLQLIDTKDPQFHTEQLKQLGDNQELDNLYKLRKEEITTTGIEEKSDIGEKLSSLNALQSLLDLINTNLYEQNRIVGKLIQQSTVD